MRKKGAVPIPYIIALVLGVIVIALLAYWLFMSGGEFGTMITESSCQAKKMSYCNRWKFEGSKPDKEFCAASGESYAPECCEFYGDLDEGECGIGSVSADGGTTPTTSNGDEIPSTGPTIPSP